MSLILEESSLVGAIRKHRLLFTMLFFGLLSAISVTLSFFIRFGLLGGFLPTPDQSWFQWWLAMLVVTVPVRILFFWISGIHKTSYRFASLEDLPPLIGSVLSGSALIIISLWLFWDKPGGFPLSSLAIDMFLCMVLATFGRYGYRLIGGAKDGLGNTEPRKRAVIVGAGIAGNLTIEAMQSAHLGRFKAVAIVDDDSNKKGMRIRGVPVDGLINEIKEVAKKRRAEVIVLAIPTASTSQLYRIVNLCQESGLPFKSIPSFWEIMESEKLAVHRVEDFSTTNLLSRRPVSGDPEVLLKLINGKRVLVTGAAGSIGSELCRQIVEHGAGYLACLDKDENGLFRIERELRDASSDCKYDFLLGDIKNQRRLNTFFNQAKPDIVFHAAAYKHVPILQFHPEEAVRNNVLGTKQLVETASRFGVKRFVMISTDKAVNPTSVMGATKQVAEKVVLSKAKQQENGTKFSIIRFGNVLGSAGSVVEVFNKQIANGGPITITHPDIERYFMTISEAVQLVLFAAAMGRGEDVFILDMGDPVKISDLAHQMIRLSGLTPEVDVKIEYTGLRPGEKLFEELWAEGEEPQPTDNPGIKVAKRQPIDADAVSAKAESMISAAEDENREQLWQDLLTLVPDFKGQTGVSAEQSPDQDSENSE